MFIMNLENYFTKPSTPILIAVAIIAMAYVIGNKISSNTWYVNEMFKRIVGYFILVVVISAIFFGINTYGKVKSKLLVDSLSTSLFNGEQIEIISELPLDKELIVEHNDKFYRIEYEYLSDGRKMFNKNKIDEENTAIGE